MRNVLRIFFTSEGSNATVVVLALLAASVFEGLGLATLLPLLTLATGVGGSDSPFNQIVHRIFEGIDPTTTLGILLLAVVGAIIVKALLTLLAMRYVGYAVADVSTRNRARLVRQLLSVRWSYLVSNPLGRFIHAVGSQAGQSGEAYRLAAMFMALAIQTSVLVVMTYIISWKLATAALILGALTAWASNFLVRRVRRAARQANQRSREMLTFLADTMANIKLLKSMARQESFENLLAKRIDQLRKSARKSVINRELMRNMQEITTAVCLGLAAFLAVGVWEVPVAELIVVGLLLTRTVQSLTKLQGQYQAAVIFESPYEELQELLAEAEQAVERGGQRPAPRLERGCRLERVTFAYGDNPVLRDASLEVAANSLTVLTGPSGEGKTTIADLLIGLYAPQSGRVTVDGVPLAELDLRSWRRQIGYVPQEPVLFHDTLMANLTLGDTGLSEDEVKEALRLAGAWPFVDELPYGLWTVVGERGAKLSGGQRQRVALARAMVHKPRLLVLDEVTSALDPDTERAICANIRGLTRAAAVLAITHRPALLEWADTIYRLERGAVHREAGKVAAA